MEAPEKPFFQVDLTKDSYMQRFLLLVREDVKLIVMHTRGVQQVLFHWTVSAVSSGRLPWGRKSARIVPKTSFHTFFCCSLLFPLFPLVDAGPFSIVTETGAERLPLAVVEAGVMDCLMFGVQ